jgi:hypothetical protein
MPLVVERPLQRAHVEVDALHPLIIVCGR